MPEIIFKKGTWEKAQRQGFSPKFRDIELVDEKVDVVSMSVEEMMDWNRVHPNYQMTHPNIRRYAEMEKFQFLTGQFYRLCRRTYYYDHTFRLPEDISQHISSNAICLEISKTRGSYSAIVKEVNY